MPCMGPSQDEAYRQGDKAFEEIYALLTSKYHVTDADLRVPSHDENGKPITGPVFGFPSEDARKLKAKLKAVVREILWQDACDGF